MFSKWIEAEAFDKLGGWVVDPAAMHVMGSSYLMAHGWGTPVADAETGIDLDHEGAYHVWVRTRDWTAVWKRGTPAGRFTLGIDGQPLPEVLGTNGPDWGWQYAGLRDLTAGKHHLALHDETGFNGRCDAIYLTTEKNAPPPDGGDELEAFRRKAMDIRIEDDPTDYDLIVAGGGMAGCTTALGAARLGLKVVLLQDRDVLGGCNSSEIRVPLGGLANFGLYPNIGNVVREIAPVYVTPGAKDASWYEDTRKANAFRCWTKGHSELRLGERVVKVEMDAANPKRIAAVVTRNTRTGAEHRYHGKLFSDCTGDAFLATMAGAETMYGAEGQDVFGESLGTPVSRREVMGLSVLWTSSDTGHPVPFPDIDWGHKVDESRCYYVTSGDWEAETGQYRDQVDEVEYIRDYSLMTTFANWSFLKNHSARKAEWANRKIDWVSACGGKRESRRCVGDHVLTQQDIETPVLYPDATAAISWNIDLHYPEPSNKARFAEPFRSCAYHRTISTAYPIPYRCLYARDVDNLFLGGRIISASHVAFAAIRVMRTLGCLGEVVAMAAKVCRDHDTTPRGVYKDHLKSLQELLRAGIPIPQEFNCYCCGAETLNEIYHFKDLGFVRFSKGAPVPVLDEETKAQIRALGKKHLFDFTDAAVRPADGQKKTDPSGE